MDDFFDDVHMGNVEIGESNRGMQDTIGATQRALSSLRGNLAQLARGRFGAHAPVQKTLRSPYKDSSQIGISATGTFTPANWAGSNLPTVSGTSRVYKSFKPEKAVITELLVVTFSNESLGAVTRAKGVTDAADVVLTSAFSGADNCFPNAPNEQNGIAGPTFSPTALGVGISWPTINGGIDMTVGFALESTVLYQIDPPSGYTVDDITSIVVRLRMMLLGPSLR